MVNKQGMEDIIVVCAIIFYTLLTASLSGLQDDSK